MDALELSTRIETAFRKFGYDFPIARGTIFSKPTESIQEGLQRLQLIGIISKHELEEHLQNYRWENDYDLSTLIKDSFCEEQLIVLLRNLDEWYKRYSKEQIETDET